MIIAGTGHRPKMCPCEYYVDHPWLNDLKKRLADYLYHESPSLVISGMAQGFDQWLAEAAISEGIELACYLPCKNQEAKWPVVARIPYRKILSKASEIRYISEEYTKDCMNKRNIAMIDACDKVVALWNPQMKYGGTFHAINYARSLKKDITNLWL